MTETSLRDRLRAEAEAKAHDDYEAAVEGQLQRLRGQYDYAKRRATIRGLAEAEVRPDISKEDVFGRPDTVSHQIFYSKKKSWGSGSDPAALLFQDVLAKVIELTIKYHNGRDLRRQTADRDAWQQRMADLADKGAGKVELMLDFPLTEHEIEEDEVEEEYPDGRPLTVIRRTVIKPAGWTFATAGTLMAAVDKTARLALGDVTERGEQVVRLPGVIEQAIEKIYGTPLEEDEPGSG